MIKRFCFIFLFFVLFSFTSYGQYMLEVRDSHSNEPLQGISLSGALNYEVRPNGVLEIASSALEEADSIVIFRHGYDTRTLYPPFPKSPAVVYLSRLSQNLDEVIVAVDQSARALRKSPSSIAYRETKSLFAHESAVPGSQLNALPGVYMQSGTNNTNRLTIRGVGSRTPYSSNRIRAYLGTFPLTDGNGVTVLEDLPPAIMESVEVLKGPAASLYGSGLGGVVKINTRGFDDYLQGVLVNTKLGSFGRKMLGVGGMARNENFAARGYASVFHSNGFRDNNRYERQTFYFNARQKVAQTTFSIMMLYTGLYGEIPSSLNENDFRNSPSSAAENWQAVNGYEQYNRVGINLQARTIMGQHWRNQLIVNFRHNDPYEVRPFNILDEETHAAGFTNRLKYYAGSWQVSLSAHLTRENYNWTTYETTESGKGALINEMLDHKFHANAGLLLQWQPAGNFTAQAGVSLNHVQYRLKDLQQPGATFERYQFDPVWSPSAGVNYEPWESLNLFAAISHGFSPPSLEETLMPDGLVNTDLQPEQGLMAEMGLRWRYRELLRLSATLYGMEITDMLVTRRLAEDQFMGINAGKVRHGGIEVQAIVRPLSFLSNPAVNLSIISTLAHSVNRFVEFEDQGNDYAGNHLPGIPEYNWYNMLHMELFGRYTLHLDHRTAGRQYMTDDNTLTYSGHQISSMSISARVGQLHKPHVTFTTGIRNLFDTHYAAMLLINAPSFGGSAPRYYYPGAPRNGYVSVKFNI